MAIDPKNLMIRDEVLIEAEIDGVYLGLPAFVTNVLADELWLALRLPDPRLLSLATGQKLHMTFEQGGSLIAETEFLRRLGGARLGTEKSRVFAIRRPRGVENVQRRSHVRVDLERIVRIKSFGALGGEKIGAGRTINIGAGGVQFKSEMALMFGDQLRVALVLTPRDIVVAGGPIVRIDEMPAAGAVDGTPAGATRVAMRFDRITEADQERITVHILAAARNRESVAAGPVLVAAPAAASEPVPGPDRTLGDPGDLKESAPEAAGPSAIAHS